MDIVRIQQQGSAFVVAAVGLKTPDGRMRLIPHPFGQETTQYDTLEAAIQATHRAGYDAEFQGTLYPLPDRPMRSINQPTSIITNTNLAQTLQSALPALRNQLNDTSPGVIAQAAQTLGQLKDDAAVPSLIVCLSHDDATVRKNAAEALATIGRPAIVPIKEALTDPRWLVRHSTLAVLIEMVTLNPTLVPDILPFAVPSLQDENWLVRSQAALLMGEAVKLISSFT